MNTFPIAFQKPASSQPRAQWWLVARGHWTSLGFSGEPRWTPVNPGEPRWTLKAKPMDHGFWMAFWMDFEWILNGSWMDFAWPLPPNSSEFSSRKILSDLSMLESKKTCWICFMKLRSHSLHPTCHINQHLPTSTNPASIMWGCAQYKTEQHRLSRLKIQ